MHRFLVAVPAFLAVLAAATPAAAQSRCSAPELGDWHSCLTVQHRQADEGIEVVEARPRLVIRLATCPARAARRSVVIRTDGGRRLGRDSVRGKCRDGVVRWTVDVRIGKRVAEGTVVRSNWERIADRGKAAPGVTVAR
jgi:hypothetical protein